MVRPRTRPADADWTVDATPTVVRPGGGADRVEPIEYVRSLDRGLAVLRAFTPEQPRPTLADVARAVGLAPATARRLLHTLQALDYVGTDGAVWALRPRALEFGRAYLATTSVWDVVQERLTALAAETEETASAGTLSADEVIYTVRVPYRRIMTMSIGIGTRIPAAASSMGRVLLAGLPAPELDATLAQLRMPALTTHTVTSEDDLRARIERVRRDGYCVLIEELELGVQCVAAPVHDASGAVLAAITLSSHTTRVSRSELRRRLLPALLRAAADIDADLASRG